MGALVRLLTGSDDDTKKKVTLTPAQRQVREDVRQAAMKANGAMVLTELIMEGLTDVDLHRRALSKGDATLNVILAEVEAEGIGQVKKIQRNLYSDWDKP